MSIPIFFLLQFITSKGTFDQKMKKILDDVFFKKLKKHVFFTFYIYNGDMKALKSAILPTPKWAVVDFSDFNYTKLSASQYVFSFRF